METLVAIILAGAVITYIGYPLFRPRTEINEEPEMDNRELDEVVAEKESTLAAIAELDFDRAMGNLSEEDYRDLRDKYRLKALALLKREDELVKADAAASPRFSSAESGRSCAACGREIEPGDRFCAGCGRPVALACPSCGAQHAPEDAFCAKCGQRLIKPRRRGER